MSSSTKATANFDATPRPRYVEITHASRARTALASNSVSRCPMVQQCTIGQQRCQEALFVRLFGWQCRGSTSSDGSAHDKTRHATTLPRHAVAAHGFCHGKPRHNCHSKPYGNSYAIPWQNSRHATETSAVIDKAHGTPREVPRHNMAGSTASTTARPTAISTASPTMNPQPNPRKVRRQYPWQSPRQIYKESPKAIPTAISTPTRHPDPPQT